MRNYGKQMWEVQKYLCFQVNSIKQEQSHFCSWKNHLVNHWMLQTK